MCKINDSFNILLNLNMYIFKYSLPTTIAADAADAADDIVQMHPITQRFQTSICSSSPNKNSLQRSSYT